MIKKIKYIIIFSALLILGLCTKSQARITTSDPTVQSGGTATITINSQEPVAYGAIDVTSSGGLTFSSVSGGTANGTKVAFAGATDKTSGIATYKFKVPTVTKNTTYKVTFSSADMGNASGNTVASSTATATVTVTAPSSSSGGSSSNSSNSGSGGSSSSNNTTSNAPSFSSVNETVYATDSVNVRSSYSTSSSVIGSLEAGDSVTRTGRATSAVNGITWSRVTYNGQTAYISSAYLTTEKPEESTNKDLKELTIEGDYTLTPEFSKDVTEYDLTVGEDVESIEINAVADDDTANVEITGNDNLLMGLNTVEIKVTAEDGTEETYTIYVTRGEVDPLGLSELTIEGYSLSPEFSSDVYEYTLDIPDLSVTSLNVNAISNMENATVEITGEDSLIQGENIITILVKSEDGENTVTYQITANIHEPEKTQLIAGIDDEDLFLYGGIALGVIIVIIIIIVIVRHNRKKDDDFGTYYGGFDSLNRDVKNDDNKFGEDDKIDYKTNVNTDNEKDADLNSDAKTSLNDGIDTNAINTEGVDFSNNSESNVDDKSKSDRKSVIEENFGADINMNRFDDDPPKRRKGKHF